MNLLSLSSAKKDLFDYISFEIEHAKVLVILYQIITKILSWDPFTLRNIKEDLNLNI